MADFTRDEALAKVAAGENLEGDSLSNADLTTITTRLRHPQPKSPE